jgi:hypothetical protein
MDDARRPDEPELKRPDEVVEDLEPDMHEADEVTGGTGSYMKLDPI